MLLEQFLQQTDYKGVDITTLTDEEAANAANLYTEIIDKKQVGSGQARGFLAGNGIWAKLHEIKKDTTDPLFGLADAVIVTASDAGSYFGLDPETDDGIGNIFGINILVNATVMTDTQKDEFLAKSFTTVYPLKDTTANQVFEVRNPLVWAPCTHSTDPAQTWTVTIPQEHLYFTIMKSIAGGSVEIRTTWATDNEEGAIQTTINHITTLRLDAYNVSTSDKRSRQQMGIPPNARILRMEFKGRDVTSVTVAKG